MSAACRPKHSCVCHSLLASHDRLFKSRIMFAPWATLATAHLVFLASTPFQLGCLHRAPTKVGPTWQGRFKIVSFDDDDDDD